MEESRSTIQEDFCHFCKHLLTHRDTSGLRLFEDKIIFFVGDDTHTLVSGEAPGMPVLHHELESQNSLATWQMLVDRKLQSQQQRPHQLVPVSQAPCQE